MWKHFKIDKKQTFLLKKKFIIRSLQKEMKFCNKFEGANSVGVYDTIHPLINS